MPAPAAGPAVRRAFPPGGAGGRRAVTLWHAACARGRLLYGLGERRRLRCGARRQGSPRATGLRRPATGPSRGSVAAALPGPGRASAALPRRRARRACLRAPARPAGAWAVGRRTAGPAHSSNAPRSPTEPPEGAAAGSHAASAGSVPVLRRSRSDRLAAGVTAGHQTCDSRCARLARQPLRRGAAIGAGPARTPAKTPGAAAGDPAAQPARGGGGQAPERPRTAGPRPAPS